MGEVRSGLMDGHLIDQLARAEVMSTVRHIARYSSLFCTYNKTIYWTCLTTGTELVEGGRYMYFKKLSTYLLLSPLENIPIPLHAGFFILFFLACFLFLALFFCVLFWCYVSRRRAIGHTTILFTTEDILFVCHET